MSYKSPFLLLLHLLPAADAHSFIGQLSMYMLGPLPNVSPLFGIIYAKLCPTSHAYLLPRPNAFFWTFTSRVAKENKHVGSHWQHTLESLSHPFSRWEALEEQFFFSFSINFHFFQVWVNSGHRATRMIWLWKLLISPSKESQLLVTEQSARSSKGLLQHDPPGFP